VASTKSYTSQFLAMAMFATLLGNDSKQRMKRRQGVSVETPNTTGYHVKTPNPYHLIEHDFRFICFSVILKLFDLQNFIQILSAMVALPDQVSRVLELSSSLSRLAVHLIDRLPRGPFLLIGRGQHYVTCREGALKINEVTYMPSMGKKKDINDMLKCNPFRRRQTSSAFLTCRFSGPCSIR
jgi:glucosamine 6-phosphate synthetase-like amidotransferase/phosphosugar isomerase protein